MILNLKKTNSVGFDNITTYILKLIAPRISKILAYLINLSFEQGCYPSALKFSIVKPIYKKGDSTQLNNYRPITLVPVISKIFERIMYDRIYNFLNKHNIFNENQFGFRKGASTSQACFTLVKAVTECLNEKRRIVAIFLDMSKAFDYVNHEQLLQKLYNYGIRGKAHDWLSSYLKERKQCTNITKIVGNQKYSYNSNWSTNDKGVPRGSILGPLLFLVDVNDLPNSTNHTCIQFADDTTVLIKQKANINFENDINNTIKDIIHWLGRNNFLINVNKTKIIEFKTKNLKDMPLNINHNGDPIERVNSYKFLGVNIDNFLNWKIHINAVCKKINKFVYALKRLSQVVSVETSLSAYHGYVSSVLNYGLIIWGNCVDSHKVFVAQKKCIRAIAGESFTCSCKPLFKKLKVLPLPSLYIKEVCLFVKKHMYYFTSVDELHNCITSSRRGYKLVLPKCRLALCQNNIYCMAIKIYNKLPTALIHTNYTQFKKKLHQWLIEKQFYSLQDYLSYTSI